MGSIRRLTAAAALSGLLALPGAARAGHVACPNDPGSTWDTATPAEAHLDGAELQEAIDFASSRGSVAVRVFRHGCLVGSDRAAPGNDSLRWESMSMAKSVTAMITARAIQLGYIGGVDDTIGAYLDKTTYGPQADAAHRSLTIRELLTQTHGLHWNLFRDYNIFMEDRIDDALDLEVGGRPTPRGQFEYHQSGVALLAKVVEGAVSDDAGGTRTKYADFQAFAQAQLFGRIGITPLSWTWERDRAGNTQGFFGLRTGVMQFARLGHLMLRGGAWNGTQLLPPAFVDEAASPSAANACYGFLIWNNTDDTCIQPTVWSADVRDGPQIKTAPTDMFSFQGLGDQRVYVIPSLQMMVVRLGFPGSREPDPRQAVFTSAPGEFEHELFARLMSAVQDAPVPDPVAYVHPDPVPTLTPEHGFLYSLNHPEDWVPGYDQLP